MLRLFDLRQLLVSRSNLASRHIACNVAVCRCNATCLGLLSSSVRPFMFF